MDRSSAATASISTPTGSFCHLTAEFPEPVVKAFLGDPTPPAKFPFCQSTVAAFLNKHSPCLRPIVVPHCQYICHLIASLPPSRKTHRAFFKFWDIISHRWVRCHAGVIVRLRWERNPAAEQRICGRSRAQYAKSGKQTPETA